jgi:hypothetical protein
VEASSRHLELRELTSSPGMPPNKPHLDSSHELILTPTGLGA